MTDITSNANGFKTVKYTISSDLFPAMTLRGFGKAGITFEEVEFGKCDIGADGLVTYNQKPVLIPCTVSLKPNSPCRNILDLAVDSLMPKFGKTLNSTQIILIESNNLTGYVRTYTGYMTKATGGNSNTLEDGQTDLNYSFEFTLRVPVPKV